MRVMRASGWWVARSADRRRVLEVDRARVCRELDRAVRVQGVAETDGIDVLLVDVDRGVGVEPLLHPVDVADGGDPVGRGVDAALEDEGVADAADGARRDD